MNNSGIRYFFIVSLYSIIIAVISFSGNNENVSIISEMLVPFGMLLSSFNTIFDKNELKKILIYYVFLSVFLGISSIFYYGQGFNITQTYFLVGKNQIGPLIGISAVISVMWFLDRKKLGINHVSSLWGLISFFLLLISLLVIRNRAGLIGIFAVFLLIAIFNCKFKLKKISIIKFYFSFVPLIILYSEGYFKEIIDFISKSFFLNYDVNNLNSLSSGRTEVYKLALGFSLEHPILGELGGGIYNYYTPHNYILNKWVNFGIVGSLPFVLLYVYFFVYSFKSVAIKNNMNESKLPIWLFIFSLVVSLFEYTYPFGPGVSQLMLWFLLGQYVRGNVE
jgi:O-antigen ligase